MLNHFLKGWVKDSQSGSKARERVWSEPFFPSTGPGPFSLKFQVGWREPWTPEGDAGFGALAYRRLASSWGQSSKWVLDGV